MGVWPLDFLQYFTCVWFAPSCPGFLKNYFVYTDLSQIRENLEELDPKPRYESKDALRAHLQLMIDNCKGYNSPETDYWAAADTLEKFIAEIFSR